jgi:hypothetical protein
MSIRAYENIFRDHLASALAKIGPEGVRDVAVV